ncbi:hypothetical protein GCK32_009235 [Trichostrongylus colubriformis]|uniref:DUF5641 domain-containing protein n=1 Tax=Trichostrongylus colubriformis TaxID=6319 RepID=A0AAN8G000_TRICO
MAEYLVSHIEQYQHSHKHPRSETRTQHPKLHEHVTVHDDKLKRGQWRFGRIIGSNDQFQRTVQVRMANKKVITKFLNFISPLKLSSHKEYLSEEEHGELQQKSSSRPCYVDQIKSKTQLFAHRCHHRLHDTFILM